MPRPMYRIETQAMTVRDQSPGAEIPEPEDITVHASVEVRWAFEEAGE